MKQRVVITGIGIIAPNAIGKSEYEKAIYSGKSGVDNIKSFDTSELKFHKGCEVKNLDLLAYKDNDFISSSGRASFMAYMAAKEAIDDSKLETCFVDKDDIGVSIGTGLGEIQAVESITENLVNDNRGKITSKLLAQYKHCNISSLIANVHGFRGINTVISTACSAGNDSIIFAYKQIMMNKAKVMIAGGVDPFSKVAYIGFSRLNAIESDFCRPFDKNRKGIMVGEGAGIIVLENLENALERGAKIYGELSGYGTSCDAYHLTAPNPGEDGGTVKAISSALINSDISGADVDFICAHGTGTPINDKTESLAIKKVFGTDAYNVPVSSIKSMIGHTGGAASAIGAITCLMSINLGIIPPTINYHEQDPFCDLDYVVNKSRIHEVNVAINNSFAFGGNNSCIVLKKYNESNGSMYV